MSVVGTLSQYTLYFQGLTLVLLAVSHYLAYKNKRKSLANQVILWVSTVVSIGAIIYTNQLLLGI
ncbi:MAG: hypothetical protein M0Z31_09225 [Clostridia bacterium]|nr:hypothetical protein [Clostridia bacterium]